MKKRPEFVTVGPFTYEIDFTDEQVCEDLGKTDFLNRKITIFPNRDEQVMKETLCHEILHVALIDVIEAICTCDSGLGVKEERLVVLVNPRIFQTYRDNPDVTRYIFGV